MSFAEKFSAIMERPGQDPVGKDEVPWWMKYAGRGLGTVGSVVAMFLGVWNCVSIVVINVECLISGIWQIMAGFIVIVIEAPCCCFFVDFVQNLSDWVEKRPYWNRGAFYLAISLPAIFMCPGISSIFGSGLIFTTGIIYGLMALGKKASLDEMRTTAATETVPSDAQSSGLHSTLVDHAQPVSFINPPTPSYGNGV